VKHFPIQVPGTQVQKLQQIFVGPFEIESEVNPGAFKLKLPYRFTSVHPVFNEADLRPWVVLEGTDPVTNLPIELPTEEDLPKLLMHPAEKRIGYILDRKAAPGAPPKDVPIRDLPCQYLVRYAHTDRFYGEWLPSDEVAAQLENQGLDDALDLFEAKYPRTHPHPCKGVSAYRDPTGLDVSAVATGVGRSKLSQLPVLLPGSMT
jgi:hypothetical protein